MHADLAPKFKEMREKSEAEARRKFKEHYSQINASIRRGKKEDKSFRLINKYQ